MADKQPNNQRYSDLAWETWRTSGFHAAIDAVVAAVREDVAQEITAHANKTAPAGVTGSRAARRRSLLIAAQIAAKPTPKQVAAHINRLYAARIAEGTTDRA